MTNDAVRRATTDALCARGAARADLDALTTEQFDRFVQLVVEWDASGKEVTWSAGLRNR